MKDRTDQMRSNASYDDGIAESIDKSKHIKSNESSKNHGNHLIILDWDDTLFPSRYLLSKLECLSVVEDGTKITGFKIKGNNKNELSLNLDKIGGSTLSLLRKLIYHFKSCNIKIVTNAMYEWVFNSLLIASSFSKIWFQIKDLLILNEIDIIYARNDRLEYMFWKKECFDVILSQFDLNNKCISIITIGDQWHDHDSVKRSDAFKRFKDNICHHQIKFMDDPECDYLKGELEYVTDLMEPNIISTFENEGIILEFDG